MSVDSIIAGIVAVGLGIAGFFGLTPDEPVENLGDLRVITAPQGGTGIGSATAGDVGKVIRVLDDSPFTYELATVTGGSGGGSNWTYDGSRLTPSTTVGIGVFASSTITDLSMTNATITNAFSFGGVVGTAWSTFCTAITGGSGLCDGNDATGGGGGGSISTSSIPVAGNLTYWTSDSTVSDVATGTLTENATGLEFSATRGLVGGASILSLTSGFNIPLTASTTNWESFYLTPSTRITAGTGIDWSGNTLNGVYTAGDAITLNGEDFDFDGGATPAGALGGTWASPTVDDDGHNHTGTTLSGIDISSDTNLSADGTEIILTGDALSLGTNLTFTNATTTNIASTGLSTTSALSVSNSVALFGGAAQTSANALCIFLTGSSALCDGSDATGGAGGDSNWTFTPGNTYVSPATTTNGIIVYASSTIGGGTGATGLTVLGNSTTTGSLIVQGTGTSTFAGGINMGTNHLVAHGVHASESAGFHIHSNNGTEVAFFGAGGGSNITFPGYTSNGFLKTSGGSGALTVDTTTYESGLTAGDGLTRTVNDFDCDIASASVFGCLSTTDWTAFNGKVSTTSSDTEAELEAWLTDVTNVFTNNDGALADDNLTNNQIDDLSDVGALSETLGDVLLWSGTEWVDRATSTLGLQATIVDGDALTFSGNTLNFDGGNTPGGELGGTWASPTLDDSVAVSSWNLTTPTFTTNFTFDGVTVTGLSGIDPTVLTGTVATTDAVLTVDANDDIVEQGLTWNITAATCTGDGNGGTLTVNGSNQIICSADDGGAGSGSKWTDAGTFTYLTATTDDIAFGSTATATSPFWWDVSATTSYIGNGGAGDSSMQFGPDGYAWTIGFDDTDDTFAIASSTSLGTSNAFSIDKALLTTIVNATGTTFAGFGLTDCDADNQTLSWDVTTSKFGCGDDDGGGAYGDADVSLYLYGSTTRSDLYTAGDALTWTGTTLNFDGGNAPLGELGGTWASPSIDDSLAVSNWNLTTPTFTTSFTFDLETFDSLTDDITLANNAGDLQVVDVTCTDCLNATEIEDLYLLLAGDSSSGNYTLTGVIDVSGGVLDIPSGTAPTVDAAGEIALDTTDDQLIMADGAGTARVFATEEFRVISVTVASTSPAFTSGNTLPALSHKDGLELTQYRCWVSGGTSKVVNITDGTNDTETITCNTTISSDTDVATNDTFTADELGSLEMGATTGTVNYLHFEAYARITRE